MGIEDIFNGTMEAEPEVITPANEQPPVEPVETPEAEAVEPQPAPEQPQEPQPQEEARHVPLATFLDQRDELKRWRAEAEQLRQQVSAKPQHPQEVPDPLDDPQGFASHQERVVEQKLTEQRFQISDVIARQQHGSEAVDAAGQWAAERAATDRSFAIAYMQQQHPIDWIVQQHKRDQLMQQIGNDPDEWVRRRYAELNPTPAPSVAPVVTPAATPAPPPPPRSLASAPGSAGVKDIATGPMAALGDVFRG